MCKIQVLYSKWQHYSLKLFDFSGTSFTEGNLLEKQQWTDNQEIRVPLSQILISYGKENNLINLSVFFSHLKTQCWTTFSPTRQFLPALFVCLFVLSSSFQNYVCMMLKWFPCRKVFPGQISLGYTGLNKYKEIYLWHYISEPWMCFHTLWLSKQRTPLWSTFKKLLDHRMLIHTTTTTTTLF